MTSILESKISGDNVHNDLGRLLVKDITALMNGASNYLLQKVNPLVTEEVGDRVQEHKSSMAESITSTTHHNTVRVAGGSGEVEHKTGLPVSVFLDKEGFKKKETRDMKSAMVGREVGAKYMERAFTESVSQSRYEGSFKYNGDDAVEFAISNGGNPKRATSHYTSKVKDDLKALLNKERREKRSGGS
jgi:hypothetical protein